MSRWRYFGKRVAMTIPVMWLGLSMTWFVIYMGPISPAAYVLGQSSTQDIDKFRNAQERLGLDEPPLEHYTEWLWNVVTLDWGHTWILYPGSSVSALVADFLPRTLWLGFWSVLIAVVLGIPLGFYAGMRSNTGADYLTSFGGIVWRAMPNFWLAVMVLTVLLQSESIFGVDWQVLTVDIRATTGTPQLKNLHRPKNFLRATKKVLPAALVLGSASMGNEVRIARTAVVEAKNEQYVDLAKAKGVSGRALVWKHIFRNALIPLVPIITGEAFLLIGGSVLVETVFGITGIGWLFFRAARVGDLPLVSFLMAIFIVLMLSINILQDFLYTLIDPRVGYEEET